jgi:hypothetical protein
VVHVVAEVKEFDGHEVTHLPLAESRPEGQVRQNEADPTQVEQDESQAIKKIDQHMITIFIEKTYECR